MKNNRSYLYLAAWLIILLSISTAIGFTTNAGKDDWYDPLLKSSLTPPGWVFGVVWPILYIMIGVAGWLAWRAGARLHHPVMRLYLAQLVLNWGWSFVFFTFHQITPGFFWIIALGLVVAATIKTMIPWTKMGAALMVPYVLWLGFAAYLNGMIMVLN